MTLVTTTIRTAELVFWIDAVLTTADTSAVVAGAILVDQLAVLTDANDALAIAFADLVSTDLPFVCAPADMAVGIFTARTTIRNRATGRCTGVPFVLRTRRRIDAILCAADSSAFVARPALIDQLTVVSGALDALAIAFANLRSTDLPVEDAIAKVAGGIVTAGTTIRISPIAAAGARTWVRSRGCGWIHAVATGTDAGAAIARFVVVDGNA